MRRGRASARPFALSVELDDLRLGFRAVRSHVDVQPVDVPLDPHRHGEAVGVVPDQHPRGVRRQVLDGEVPRLAEDVRGEVDALLAPHQLAPVAPETPLMVAAEVAEHGPAEDLAAEKEQHLEEVGVQEVPRPLPVLGEGVLADELLHLEVRRQVADYLLPFRHGLTSFLLVNCPFAFLGCLGFSFC